LYTQAGARSVFCLISNTRCNVHGLLISGPTLHVHVHEPN
jgi:hypothetical protein